jgi:hypothetical protein
MTDRDSVPVPTEEVVEEKTIRLFLHHCRRPRPKERGRDGAAWLGKLSYDQIALMEHDMTMA